VKTTLGTAYDRANGDSEVCHHGRRHLNTRLEAIKARTEDVPGTLENVNHGWPKMRCVCEEVVGFLATVEVNGQ
jgi:hypothetical protein